MWIIVHQNISFMKKGHIITGYYPVYKYGARLIRYNQSLYKKKEKKRKRKKDRTPFRISNRAATIKLLYFIFYSIRQYGSYESWSMHTTVWFNKFDHQKQKRWGLYIYMYIGPQGVVLQLFLLQNCTVYKYGTILFGLF